MFLFQPCQPLTDGWTRNLSVVSKVSEPFINGTRARNSTGNDGGSE